jgi:hypothetical protein
VVRLRVAQVAQVAQAPLAVRRRKLLVV